jgi:hypothetical protein
MKRLERLEQLKAEMIRWTGDGDIEIAHSQADSLLLEVLRVVAGDATVIREAVDQIIDAYELVDKWYA